MGTILTGDALTTLETLPAEYAQTCVNTPKSTTIVSSIRLDGTQVPLYLSGALKGDSFLSYIWDNLVPTLHDHDIVIMDN